MLLALFFTHRGSSTHQTDRGTRATHSNVVMAAAHTRLVEKREQHTVAVLAAVAVTRQTLPPQGGPQVSSSSVNIPINAPRGKRGNVSRDHTTTLNSRVT